MNIGIFDSGLGGLYTMQSIVKKIPEYNYVYLGDTLHLPYGVRSHAEIYRFLKEALMYLFEQDCTLIIVACNTASAQALRRVQREFLPKHFPDRRVLGVIVPNIEEAMGVKRVGILATTATVQSKTYPKEFKKYAKDTKIFQIAAPRLVPMIESGKLSKLTPVLKSYLTPLLDKNIDALILACTHYPIIKKQIRAITGKKIKVICQDEFIAKKIQNYLARHKDIQKKLTKKKERQFFVTKKTPYFEGLAKKWFGRNISLKQVALQPFKKSDQK